MPRGKDAPTRTGGKIDPYVQRSILQSRQLAESRLLAAMREAKATSRTAMTEAGATSRTAMQETGAMRRAELGERGAAGRTAMTVQGALERATMAEGGATARAGIQAGAQRGVAASQAESEDKRAAEAVRAQREERKFATTMAETAREFQAKQAQLNRDQQNAIITGDRKAKDEIEKRREALRRFNIELGMDAAERNTNAMLSIIKGSLKRETSMEKAKTVLEEEATRFDKDKDVYLKTRERVTEAVEFDKRMDLPIEEIQRGKISSRLGLLKEMGIKGPITASYESIRKGEALRKQAKEGFADPMGVLQDQITKYGGSISVEEMAPENINKIEDQIQKGDIKTEDINKTLGAIEGVLEAVKTRRTAADKDSDEFDFWQDTHLNISQMRDGLEGLANSKKKIVGSETETVGARVQYALGTVQDSSLGGRAARMRDLVGGNFEAVFEEMTKSIQVPKLYDISTDMNKYDIEYRTWFNDYLGSRYPEIQGVE